MATSQRVQGSAFNASWAFVRLRHDLRPTQKGLIVAEVQAVELGIAPTVPEEPVARITKQAMPHASTFRRFVTSSIGSSGSPRFCSTRSATHINAVATTWSCNRRCDRGRIFLRMFSLGLGFHSSPSSRQDWLFGRRERTPTATASTLRAT